MDVKTLVGNNSGLLYKLIPTENTVIILDDIERVINTIDVHTLWELSMIWLNTEAIRW